MQHPILSKKRLKLMLDKMGPIVTNDYARATKAWKDELFKELGYDLFKELGYDPLIDGRSLSPMVVDDLTKSALYNNLIIHLKY